MKPNLLYKIHGNFECDQLQNITRYLYYMGYDLRPNQIIERSFPSDIKVLPTIIINNYPLSGLNNIVDYYEKMLGIQNLLTNANKFCELNPNYKITDKSTHKKIVFN
ncbi:hypothetical protein QKU48_gp1087 [Fadolivirus algeromassiliense]|jgi:hypothetical protein|uniref:Glutaredoxin n=1 Tax=Fadolivirus FV1/VV64 TaxID=3070911 RepID=A0A7D3QUX6_9VIRU|nr:hypothetical protein QKU48_gp1087 [Fadolivirus algeromassiliense]QKF94545.1 hypothetical protein Fadolivirus_1_1087 [Fadolivirus FV1/VV64]